MMPGALYRQIGALYASIFLSFGVFAPFFPVWLAHKAFSAEEIGWLMAVPNLMRMIFLPPFMHWADRYRHLSTLIALAALASAAVLLVLTTLTSWVFMLASLALWAFFWNPVLPLAEAFALNQVRSAGIDFGRARLWGSLAFIAGSMLAGVLINKTGPHIIVWIIFACMVLPSLLWPWLKAVEGTPLNGHARTENTRQNKAYTPYTDIPLLLVLAGVALLQSSHAVYYIFSAEHWLEKGLASSWISMLWSLGVVAEVVLFWRAGRWILRTGSLVFIVLGGCGATLRWLLMALDPGLAGLIPLQILHAFSFAAPYLGLMAFLSTRVPSHSAARVQGLSAALQAGVMALVTVGAGMLWHCAGVYAYGAMAALCVLGIVVILFVVSRIRAC